MDGRELVRQFKAAPWRTGAEIEKFLLAADVVPAAELLRLLPLLSERSLASDLEGHRSRCLVFKRLAENAPDPQLFIPFVRAMKSADGGVRALLASLLPRVNSVPGHGELIGLLRMPDGNLRRLVSQAARQIGGKAIFEAAGAIVYEEGPGRMEALEVATFVGRYHAIPVLEYVVVNGRAPEKAQALRWLGDSQLMAKEASAALEVIAHGLKDPIEQVRVQAIVSYAGHCTEEDFYRRFETLFDDESVAVVRACVEAARKFPTRQTIDALERKLRMGPNAVRLAVLESAEAIGSDVVLPLIAEALHSRHSAIRTRAGEVLSRLSHDRRIDVAQTVLWLLRSSDHHVRRMAVDLITKVGDAASKLWPALLRFLRDEDWWVRERVVDALVEVANHEITPHVLPYLQDPSDVVRRYAVDVLMRLKDPNGLAALVRCAGTDGDWWVRERAVEAVGEIGDPRAVPYLVDLMNRIPDLRLSCLDAVAKMKATQAGVHVAALLSSEDVDVRLMALRCLETLHDTSQAGAVNSCLADVDHRVRQTAKDILARWNFSHSEGGVPGHNLSMLERLLVATAKAEGDDLILSAGRAPYIKRMGKVIPLGKNAFTARQMEEILLPQLTDSHRGELEALRDVDFSYEVKTEGLRFRANVFRQQTGLGAVFRIVKNTLVDIEDLGLPPVVRSFGNLKNGLVLVGGPTGSGKSTTLASLIDCINRTSQRHVVTLEDPIEVLHERRRSVVNQREIGTHTRSFSSALRSLLREDPDVILVGEMRDPATIGFAVTAAETGHLVLGTLHTVSADTTVDRIINAFPAGQQAQVRSMLADSLRAVVCQHLLRRVDVAGKRAIAVEVMINNDAISNLVRKGKAFQLPSVIATSRDQGMQTMDWDLRRLLREGKVSPDEAYMKANNKKEFEEFLSELRKEKEKKEAPSPVSGGGPRMQPMKAVGG